MTLLWSPRERTPVWFPCPLSRDPQSWLCGALSRRYLQLFWEISIAFLIWNVSWESHSSTDGANLHLGLRIIFIPKGSQKKTGRILTIQVAKTQIQSHKANSLRVELKKLYAHIYLRLCLHSWKHKNIVYCLPLPVQSTLFFSVVFFQLTLSEV